MSDTALMVPDNLSHNVMARLEEAKTRLSDLANVYLVTEVAGQSQATLDAKRRDLQRFLTFYQKLYKHDRPDEWFVSVTKAFLKALQQERLAQASLVRIYATVRHFARWLHRKFPALFPLGCPTDGVKPPAEPTAEWKGLTRVEEIRLLRRFPAKNLPCQAVDIGWIKMSYLGNVASRFKRASTARIAALPREMPFWYTWRLSFTTGCRPFHVMLLAHSSIVCASMSFVPFQCCSKIPQHRSIGLYLL